MLQPKILHAATKTWCINNIKKKIMRRQAKAENIHAIYISEKELIFRIYEELSQLNNKKISKSV